MYRSEAGEVDTWEGLLVTTPRILLYDLEVTPLLGWAYKKWDTNLISIERDSYIMCFSYKWYGEKKIRNVAQSDYQGAYGEFPYNDSLVVLQLWTLMDKADIVVAHNANKFDNRIATARFLFHHLGPPAPYKSVDTLMAARRYFRMASNSLNDLCEKLELGSKPKDTHGKLWRDCVDGDMDAWKKMKKYCNQDVALLSNLYDELRPFMTSHPNLGGLAGVEDVCPRCSSTSLQRRGFAHTATCTYQRWQCNECDAWSRSRKSDNTHPTLVNA